MKKLILLLTGIITTVICILGIISLSVILMYAEFKQGKLFVIAIFLLIIAGFGFTAFKSFKLLFHHKNVNTKQESISTTHDLPATINDIVPYKSQKVITESIKNNEIQEPDNIKTNILHNKTNNIIYKIDNKAIIDENISYSIQPKHKKIPQAEQEAFNPKFHRTAHEEDLSYNFAMKYGHEVSLLEEEFETLYKNANMADNLTEKIFLLNESVKAFEKARDFCYKKGKGGTIYFQDMWECLHNSQKPCFSYLDNIKTSLDKTMLKRDIVIPSIINTITVNDGILQKDIYKLLPDIDKPTIQQTIKELTIAGTISTIKKGNSYELHKL